MIPDAAQIAQDAVTIRGILELLASPEPISAIEVANTQHVSIQDAHRLLRSLFRAKVIEHPSRERTVLGMTVVVPQIMLWQLTKETGRMLATSVVRGRPCIYP